MAYLGGLGPTGAEASKHLRSRHEVAAVPGERVPGSSTRARQCHRCPQRLFEMLRYLVERLPAIITAAWVDTGSQPVGVEDVAGTLAELAGRDDVEGEVQLGRAEVLTYREMIGRAWPVSSTGATR